MTIDWDMCLVLVGRFAAAPFRLGTCRVQSIRASVTTESIRNAIDKNSIDFKLQFAGARSIKSISSNCFFFFCFFCFFCFSFFSFFFFFFLFFPSYFYYYYHYYYFDWSTLEYAQ